MIRTLTILIFLILGSCSTTKDVALGQIEGRYMWNGCYSVSSIIDLNSDHTFEYNWQTGLMFGKTIGTWRNDGFNIVLNSEIQPNAEKGLDYRVFSSKTIDSDSITVKVIESAGVPVPMAICELKRGNQVLTRRNTNLNGEVNLPKLNTDSLIISFIGFKTIRHKLDHSVSTLAFEMMKEDGFYQYFSNEVWTYRKGLLYDPSIKKNECTLMDYYKRIE